MEIRVSSLQDRGKILELLLASQKATGLPDPTSYPPESIGEWLYKRNTLQRYVAIEDEVIVGHGMIEAPNPQNVPMWRAALNNDTTDLIELGGAFTDPSRIGEGIWTSLLEHRINIVRSLGSIPVSATWSSNEHVKRTFMRQGAKRAGILPAMGGNVELFVW